MASCERPDNDNSEVEGLFQEFEIDGKKWSLPRGWKEQGEGFRNFKAKPDDVWIVTQPRSGTTFTQELVWLVANDMDFENAKKFHLLQRSPELPVSLFPYMWEKCQLLRPSREDPKVLESVPVDKSKYSYEIYVDAISPRILKTHLPLSAHKNIFDSGCKIVYVLRNPKDVLVSQARFCSNGPDPLYKGELQNFMKEYIANGGRGYGPYWEHVKEAWALRDHPNLLFMYYEDMRRDLPASIRKVAKFLGKSYTDEQVSELAAHLHIDNFRKNPMVNDIPGLSQHVQSFIGKGHVGGWNEIVTPEFEVEIDRWIEENTKDTDIVFSDLKRKEIIRAPATTPKKLESYKSLEVDYKMFEIEGKMWSLPVIWEEQGEGIRNFEKVPKDVWIVTQPRSGTTLSQELVWLLMNNLDFETASKFHLMDRSPLIEASLVPFVWEKCCIVRPSSEDSKVLESSPVDTSKASYEVYANYPSPRVIKTHLALSVHRGLLDSGCKIVYVMRNPKDMLVSRGRFATSGSNPLYRIDIRSYIKNSIDDDAPISPIYGPYWPHVKEAWANRHHPNLLLIHYEDLRRELPASIKKIASFLGKSYSDEQISRLAAYLSIESFRKNPMVNELPGMEDYVSTFIGNGRVGGWREIMTPELEEECDRWIEKHMKGTDIVFPYDSELYVSAVQSK